MAICGYCGREMLEDVGCTCSAIKFQGKKIQRIPYGDVRDLFGPVDREKFPTHRCGDCGARVGFYHHPECDAEKCPICGEQLISCNCDFQWVLPEDED